jgi:predicted nucleotidyltransferase
VAYCADASFLQAMRDAARQVHQAERSFHHYVHMARENCREYLRGDTVRLKKYWYVLRPLLATLWVERGLGVAPMRFQELVDAIVTDADLLTAIHQLLAIKRAIGEAEYGRPLSVINAFIEAELTRLESVAPLRLRDQDFAILDRLLMDTVLRLDATYIRTD